MKDIIENIIELATVNQDYELADLVSDLIDKLASTFNAPSNWRNIGEELYAEFNGNQEKGWAIENCKLYEYEF